MREWRILSRKQEVPVRYVRALLALVVALTLALPDVALVLGGADAQVGAAEAARSPRLVAPVNFSMAGTEFAVRPAEMGIADLCSPAFVKLRWASWGPRTARSTGRARYPQVRVGESCAEAYARARLVAVTVWLSRPVSCHGQRVLSRIRWSSEGRRGRYGYTCV